MLEKEAINLDDLEVYPRLDPQSMLTHLHNFPELCEQAWDMAGNFNLPEEYSRVKKVVILGMGGSAIGGDLVGSLAVNEVCRTHPGLPGLLSSPVRG